MENPENRNLKSHEKSFDVESRDKVRGALTPLIQEIGIVVEASELKNRTKQEMQEFLQKFLMQLEDDDYVSRVWVSFTPDGNIMRARSEEGIYDLDNTLRYLWSELGGFLSPLSVALNDESQQEMREVKKAIQDCIETLE